ncbi:MAG: zinc-ribbon and DUF3426 domain-containing protein [Lysobacterales bacterium]|jgi:predicted Zn finger-like uncharacterized protein
MFTRCPACHTVHPVNASVLAQGGGRFRCGKCNKVGNALLALFDEWPEPGQHPPGPGGIPVLGAKIDLAGAADSRLNPEEARLSGEPDEDTAKPSKAWRLLLRSAWILATLAVLGFAAYRIAVFKGFDVLEQQGVRSALVSLGLKDPPPPAKPFRDVSRIHVVSRELRSHPARPGQLQLSATIVNRAERSQPYPEIEVVLLDASGQTLSTQRFKPADYLSPQSARSARMAPQAYLPLVLDLEDPGPRAVGFELRFD